MDAVLPPVGVGSDPDLRLRLRLFANEDDIVMRSSILFFRTRGLDCCWLDLSDTETKMLTFVGNWQLHAGTKGVLQMDP